MQNVDSTSANLNSSFVAHNLTGMPSSSFEDLDECFDNAFHAKSAMHVRSNKNHARGHHVATPKARVGGERNGNKNSSNEETTRVMQFVDSSSSGDDDCDGCDNEKEKNSNFSLGVDDMLTSPKQ